MPNVKYDKPIWLIQDFQDEDSYKKLANEVIKQGMEVSFIPCINEEMKSYIDKKSNAIVTDDCGFLNRPIIVQASMNAVKYIQKQKPIWSPGPWTTWSNYECTKYYAYLGKYIINNDYVMLPRSEVYRRIDYLFDTIGIENSIFIRPSSGYKYFSGQVFKKETFQRDWEWVDSFTCHETMLVISSPKKIILEYRFVVVSDSIITGSTYDKERDVYTQLDNKGQAWIEAQKILNDTTYRPDDIFILDISWDDRGLYNIMELNSFSCAGLYNCDLEFIVKEASELAIRNFLESRP